MSTRDSVKSGGSGLEDGLAPVESLAPAEGLASPEALVRNPPTREGMAPTGQGELSAPSVDIAWLQSEVQRANRAAGQQRRQLADAINNAFARLGQTGGSRGVADFLLQQLESGALRELVDSEGRTCRAVATEALLAMGYPYALEISPEDLEHLRESTSGRRALTPWRLAGLGPAFMGGLFELLRSNFEVSAIPGMVQAALGIAAAVVAATTKAKTAERWMSLAALLVAGLIGLGLSAIGLGEPALIGGIGAVVAWVVLVLER